MRKFHFSVIFIETIKKNQSHEVGSNQGPPDLIVSALTDGPPGHHYVADFKIKLIINLLPCNHNPMRLASKSNAASGL